MSSRRYPPPPVGVLTSQQRGPSAAVAAASLPLSPAWPGRLPSLHLYPTSVDSIGPRTIYLPPDGNRVSTFDFPRTKGQQEDVADRRVFVRPTTDQDWTRNLCENFPRAGKRLLRYEGFQSCSCRRLAVQWWCESSLCLTNSCFSRRSKLTPLFPF